MKIKKPHIIPLLYSILFVNILMGIYFERNKINEQDSLIGGINNNPVEYTNGESHYIYYLDSGHGDRGNCCGYKSRVYKNFCFFEWKYNWVLRNELMYILRKNKISYKLTNKTQNDLSLDSRIKKMVDSNKNKFLISLHSNYYKDTSVNYYQAFVRKDNTTHAQKIFIKMFEKEFKGGCEKHRVENFRILKGCKNSILLEMGFFSNDNRVKNMLNIEQIKNEANKIYKCIKEVENVVHN